MIGRNLLINSLVRLIGVSAFSLVISVSSAHARDIGIAFLEDGSSEPAPRLSSLILQELQPLLRSNDKLVPVFYGSEDVRPNIKALLDQALANNAVDYIVATGFFGSQEMYAQPRYSKATYLLRVLDPKLTGAQVRDKVKNLRSYSTVNTIAGVFERLSELFGAQRVAIVIPGAAIAAPRSINSAVTKAATETGMEAQFVALDFDADIEPQVSGFDAVILPPVATSEQRRDRLLQVLKRKKIPSYAVGGDKVVFAGALMSDTLDEDDRVLARRAALDLQLAISGESRTTGMRLLEAKRRTTINIDTAEVIDVDFSFDELMAARVVRGNGNGLQLGFLSSLELARVRNLALKGQYQQLRVDQESVEQARASRRPQLNAQIAYTRRGESLPEQDTLTSLSLSQTIYSASSNAELDIAEIGLGSSKSSLEQKQLDTVQQTAAAYFQALQTQAQFESSLRDLALNRENLELAENRKQSGSGTGADIYRWQAIIANSESALLRAYTDNTSAQGQLAKQLNTRLHIPSILADVDLDQPPFDLLHQGIQSYLNSTGNARLLHEASAARALQYSPQLQSAMANVATFDTSLEALKRAYYTPELSLGAQYGYYLDSSETAAGIELDDEYSWSLSVTAQLPLWLGGTRKSLMRQYGAQRTQAKTQLDEARMTLWINSGDAVNSLIANYRAIGLSDQAEAAALKSQQITQRAYKLGASSVTELLDTQSSYREAQDNADNARYQYLTALVNFQALMGEMPMLKSGAEQQQWLIEFNQSMHSEATQ